MNTPLTTFSPSASTIGQLWHPTDTTDISLDCDMPSVDALKARKAAGLKRVRVVLPGEVFRARPSYVWNKIRPLLDMLRYTVGFTECQLCLFGDQRNSVSVIDPNGNTVQMLPDAALVQTASGREQYARESAELVRLGAPVYGKWLSYELGCEERLWNSVYGTNDPNEVCRPMDELNALLVCNARRWSQMAWITLTLPVWSSPNQAQYVQYFGDQYTDFGCDWYPLTPNGDFTQIALDPAQTYDDLIAHMDAEVQPLLALQNRTGRKVRFGQWGGINLRQRNDWQTTRLLSAEWATLVKYGWSANAFYWLDRCRFNDSGSVITLASATPPPSLASKPVV